MRRRIWPEGGYFLRDLKSRNGTFLNGTPVVEACLNNNDKILIGETCYLFSKLRAPEHKIISKNPLWNEQLKRLPAFANTDYTVLVIGPSGSGKEVLARWIHENSARMRGPYTTINCSALSESLIESELFGHIKGSFTGATENRKGAFESTRGGTLFLDEIGDLPLSLQPKLLRALENKEIRPVGSDRSIQTDVRIIAATHKNLREKVMRGEFREDLFHRLNICRLSPPPLVERMEDFESLLYQFAKQQKVGFSFAAIERLKDHQWPGNIRELKNLIARAAAYFPGTRIQEKHIAKLIDREESALPYSQAAIKEILPPIKEMEKDLIVQKLQKHSGNQRRAADELRMPKSTFHDKLKAYGINPKLFKKRGRF